MKVVAERLAMVFGGEEKNNSAAPLIRTVRNDGGSHVRCVHHSDPGKASCNCLVGQSADVPSSFQAVEKKGRQNGQD